MQVALLRRASIARRLHLALSLSATVIGSARRALRRSRPVASTREIDLEFVKIHYGKGVAQDLQADLRKRDAAEYSRA